MGMKLFGARVTRVEDPALLTGRGQFVADIRLPGTLDAAFVRSPHAHARVRAIDGARALRVSGVHRVLTLDDLPAPARQPLPLLLPNPAIRQPRTPRPLADGEVCFVGEAVAVVIADSRYAAEDGVDQVAVDWEPLPVAADCRAALAPGAAPAHGDGPDNLAARFTVGFGDVAAAFGRAAHVFTESLWQHRGGGHAIEGRAVLAAHDPVGDLLTVWSATQTPHNAKRTLVDVLQRDEQRVRVVAPPDVGGGFGPKAIFYPEEAVVPACALLLGRPVRWVEDRREHFLCATQERDQYWDVEIAVDGDGRILGVRGTLLHDTGAYLPWGIIMPYIAATTMPGPYVVPSFHLEVRVALTNKTPTTPVRGAGRPQAVFAMERLLDRVAREHGLDPAEVRRRNLVPAERMPYAVGLVARDGRPVTYDSGDYPACQAQALALAGWDGFKARQVEARRRGRYLGLGMANYVEGTGLGPFEGATVRVGPSGKVFVYTGAAPQGQAHRTTLAQLCADPLGLDVGDVTVVTGDTAAIPNGVGTFASRTAVNAGSSVHVAATQLGQKMRKLAAHVLEAAAEDLELAGGRAFVRGAPDRAVTFGALARIAVGGMPGFAMPGGLEPGLEATSYFTPSQSTYCNGTHVAEVEVDIDTASVRIVRYVVAHDSGRLINPLVVDGQVQGGVAHGIGNALYEWMQHDAEAQPLTTTFADYLLPLATDVPPIVLAHLETPTPLNPIGVKGAGEGGTIPAAAAVIAAVENALEPFGIHLTETPITPARLAALLRGAAAERPAR